MKRRSILLGLPAAIVGFGFHERANAEERARLWAESAEALRQRSAGNFVDREIVDPQTRRKILVRLRLPATSVPSPLIIYSPGLGSGLSNGSAWCEQWQRAGFAVATLAHPGTDDGLWDTSKRSLRANLADALAQPQYGLRVKDCRFAISHCLSDTDVGAKLDPRRIGVAGHSFGALTVQSLASEAAHDRGQAPIVAAVALSPGARSETAAQALKGVRLPFFCVTGDQDNYVTFGREPDAMRLGMLLQHRLAVYKHLPPGAKQLLILGRADHMTFAGEPISASRFSRDVLASDSEHVAAWAKVSSATTAFWRFYLGQTGLVDRKAYLEEIRTVLDPADRFDAS